MEDVTKLDLYELLGVDYDATSKEIKTAYRKKALSCHPDKNPDNPSAVKRFHQLSRALEILADSAAKDAYDKLLKARRAAQLRNRQLDSKRRKLKEDLERRERDAEQQQAGQNDYPLDVAKKLEAEIARLRKEGSRQLAEEVQLMKEQLRAEQEKLNDDKGDHHCEDLPRLKVTWKWQKNHEDCLYTEKSLTELFEKYGKVTGLVMSSKGRALVEFERMESAEQAMSNEAGFDTAPLSINWVQKSSSKRPSAPRSPINLAFTAMPTNLGVDDKDYESIVLMRLRQAEERKRLIQQMKENEEKT